MSTCGNDSHPAPAVGEHVVEEVSLDIITDPLIRILLNQKQMEIARIREEIRTLRTVIPLLEGASDIVEKIIAAERPNAILPTVGGQTALNLALDLMRAGVLRVETVGL